ncbi:hypothetical protein VP01_3495g1 [Puccinia sorghi]|uniref:Myb/SANT-like domain-containing protein n=1 Tax=Puccinia sorghi TaxID=27349 RepID=A0A0L6UVQ8_9BASI|nr:hypothetical protein VP01_3495g1 [Puccinia sorghi]
MESGMRGAEGINLSTIPKHPNPNQPPRRLKRPQKRNLPRSIQTIPKLMVIRRKKKENHIWKNNQKVALLQLIINQIALGKGTENIDLKAEGWNQVQKYITNRFEIIFEPTQKPKGKIISLYFCVSICSQGGSWVSLQDVSHQGDNFRIFLSLASTINKLVCQALEDSSLHLG